MYIVKPIDISPFLSVSRTVLINYLSNMSESTIFMKIYVAVALLAVLGVSGRYIVNTENKLDDFNEYDAMDNKVDEENDYDVVKPEIEIFNEDLDDINSEDSSNDIDFDEAKILESSLRNDNMFDEIETYPKRENKEEMFKDREEIKRFLGWRKNCVIKKVPKCHERMFGGQKVLWCVSTKKRECSSLDKI